MNSRIERSCEVCGSKDFSITGKPLILPRLKKFIRHDYHIIRCNNCRFYAVDPSIDFTDREWVETYSSDYFPEINALHKKKRERQLKNRISTIEKLHVSDSKIFLDIGCGEGNTLIEAMNRGWNVYGLDIVDHRKDEARSGDITFIQASLEKAELEENFFDAVYLDSVLEHTTEPVTLLRQINRILKPGGLLYIGVPNEDAFTNTARKMHMYLAGESWRAKQLNPFSDPFHVVGFSRKSLKKILTNNNFKIEVFRNFDDFSIAFNFSPLRLNFYKHLFLFFFMVAAVPFGQQYYFETFVRKEK